ncbi:MAG: response regulator transcription factor [Actinomycetota bacterium]|nr:response regulator transcription factor [Actinomycetota bacterium]
MDAREPVSVAVARFEDLVGHGLRALLSADPYLRIVADDVPHEELAGVLDTAAPRVAILNFGSLRSPIEVRDMHTSHPRTRLVVLANHPSPSECNQMLAFGATACLSKETEARDILNAIHLASRGLHVLPRTAREFGLTEPPGPELLTPREADVLELLQEGATNAQIAQALSIGLETVRTHARNIYRKLGVSSRRDLAAAPHLRGR